METLGLNHRQTVIIGGGQAGLAIGYFLKNTNRDFVILDENIRVGDSWRKRWDSLQLFTPAHHDGLPGMPFPMERGSLPTGMEMADYLENYAYTFALPVYSGIRVNRLSRLNGTYVIESPAGRITTDHVIIATGTHPCPYIPSFSSDLSKEILQMHSADYRNPDTLPAGDVLIVGAGTSGIQIAIELAAGHKVYISGTPNFHIPDFIFTYFGELFWWFTHHVLTVNTPIGRKARMKIIGGGGPLISVSADDLVKAGVIQIPRITGMQDGFPVQSDGNTVSVSSVIWSTGFRPDFSWVDLDITDETGWPKTKKGVSLTDKGLYFMGMPYQFGLSSGFIGGVGRDAAYVFKQMNIK